MASQPGGFSVGDRVYYVGARVKRTSGVDQGASLDYGTAGSVVAQAGDASRPDTPAGGHRVQPGEGKLPGGDSEGHVSILFDGFRAPQKVRPKRLSREQPPSALPGGFSVDDHVFYGGWTLTLNAGTDLGRELEYQHAGTVVGRRAEGDADDEKFVAVQFQGLRKLLYVSPPQISRERPPSLLPGGFNVGDMVYFSGWTHTLSGSGRDAGKELEYRHEGVVAGRRAKGEADDNDFVMVHFKGHSEGQAVKPAKLSREEPPLTLPGGYVVGDRVLYFLVGDRFFYAGWTYALTSGPDSGKELAYGDVGTIVGRRSEGDGQDDKFVVVQFQGLSKPIYVPPAQLSKDEPPLNLPGGLTVGGNAYYVSWTHTLTSGPNAGKQLAYRQKGVVRGRRVQQADGDDDGHIVLHFSGHDEVQRVRPLKLSMVEPSEELNGGFKAGEKVYFREWIRTLTSGPDAGKELTYGHDGEIVGPRCEGDGEDVNYIAVIFSGFAKPLYMKHIQLSRDALSMELPGKLTVRDTVFYAGWSHRLGHGADAGQQLAYGQEGVVVGRRAGDNEGEDAHVMVRFAGHTEAMRVRPSKLACHAPSLVLPGGFKLEDCVYYCGWTHKLSALPGEAPDVLEYRQAGRIVGIRDERSPDDEKYVAVHFNHHARPTYVRVTQLSREEPPTQLPGGYSMGDRVFYASWTQTIASGPDAGSALQYRQAGAIVGRRSQGDGRDDEYVTVQFEGHTGTQFVRPMRLSRNQPPVKLPCGVSVGDKVYYVGCTATLSTGNDVGKELQYRMEGEVVGRRAEGKDDDDNFAAVLFAGHDKPMYVLPIHLAAEQPPMRLPGGFSAGETVYYSGFSHEVSSGPNIGKQLEFRHQGKIAGPRPQKVTGQSDTDAECLMVRFQGHSDPQRVRAQRISRESPSPNLAGGLEVDMTVYYAGGTHAVTSGPDQGRELTYAQEGRVLGGRCEGDGEDDRYVAVRFVGLGGVMYMPPQQLLRERPTTTAPAAAGPTPPPGEAAGATTGTLQAAAADPTPSPAADNPTAEAPTQSPVDTEAAVVEEVPVRPETPYVKSNDLGVPAAEVLPETPSAKPAEPAPVPTTA